MGKTREKTEGRRRTWGRGSIEDDLGSRGRSTSGKRTREIAGERQGEKIIGKDMEIEGL